MRKALSIMFRGAAVAFPIVHMAMAMLHMATFSSANVSTGSDHHE